MPTVREAVRKAAVSFDKDRNGWLSWEEFEQDELLKNPEPGFYVLGKFSFFFKKLFVVIFDQSR